MVAQFARARPPGAPAAVNIGLGAAAAPGRVAGATASELPDADSADERGRVFVGGDLAPSTLLAAYRGALFPMRQGDGQLAWWSPDPRAVLLPNRLHVARSLRRALNRFEIRVDSAFEAVVDGCAARSPEDYHWITGEVREAFVELHRLGWAHSVEAWTRPTDGAPAELAGGLYGIAIGRFFGGESMFHRQRDASKAALVGLVDRLAPAKDTEPADGEAALIDCQWMTPHLASLGAVEVARGEYRARLERALAEPAPAAFGSGTPDGSR